MWHDLWHSYWVKVCEAWSPETLCSLSNMEFYLCVAKSYIPYDWLELVSNLRKHTSYFALEEQKTWLDFDIKNTKKYIFVLFCHIGLLLIAEQYDQGCNAKAWKEWHINKYAACLQRHTQRSCYLQLINHSEGRCIGPSLSWTITVKPGLLWFTPTKGKTSNCCLTEPITIYCASF